MTISRNPTPSDYTRPQGRQVRNLAPLGHIAEQHRIPSSQAVVREDFKYVRWPEWTHEQLFDLRIDPTEKKNRVEHPEYQDILQSMRTRLDGWLQSAASH